MNDIAHILNPLNNPIFYPVLYRTIAVFALGFILIWVLNKFTLKGVWTKELGKRYLSWLIIGPLFLVAVLFGGDVALVFLGIILLFSLWEVGHIAKMPKMYRGALYFLAIVSVYVVSYQTSYFYSLPIFYFLVLSAVAISQNDAKKGFFNMSVCLYAAIWIIFSLSHFVLLGHLNNTLDHSKALLILLGFAVPLSDVFAYVVGRAFQKIPSLDKHKIASNLSSKKSYVGVLGNILGAALGILIMWFAVGSYLPKIHWVILAILMGVMGVVGDITESMFKRYYGVKDSSHLIPGHGGFLDRIDSILRIIVVLYYYLLFFL
jgi:phosphatidate cytidylyltransferase